MGQFLSHRHSKSAMTGWVAESSLDGQELNSGPGSAADLGERPLFPGPLWCFCVREG